MLIEAMTKTREKDNFRCYIEFAELEDKPNTYIVTVANTLSKKKMAFIRKTFLKRDAKHSQPRHGIICNFNPLEFIKEEFDVIEIHTDYLFLDTEKDIKALCELEDRKLIDSNSIHVGERKYKNGSKVIYYLKSTPEISDIVKLHSEG